MSSKLRTYLLPFFLMVLSVFAAPRFVRAQTCGIYPKTFTYTGTVQTYTVPAGVYSIRVDAWGAAGGSSGTMADAGKGARVQATLAVSPGQVFKVVVGGAGQSTGYHDTYLDIMPGGYNGGGGNTGWSFTSTGGGATDLRSSGGTLADRLVVAGGGGGGHFNGYYGGDGGAPNGEDGQNGNAPLGSYWGGKGATTSTGYALEQGGKGDCGGGGGYWGGQGSNGGGWTGLSGGGGGGSSWVTPTGSSAITMTAGANAAIEHENTPTYNSGHGFLTITPGTLVTVPAPTITSFTPTNGPLGTSVVLTGTGLGCATAVAFQAMPFHNMPAANFSVSADGTKLTVIVPDWGAATGPITVTAPSGTATTANAFTLTTITSPRLISLSPTNGPVGTIATITGDYFTAATSVSFNGTAATTYTVNSATQITATVPAGATSGNVVLSTIGACCSSIGVPFTVDPPPGITSLSPSSGTAGTSVIITGTNFTGATGVTFNGKATTSFTVNSATQITATVPAVASGNVVVTTTNGTSNGVSFTVIGPYITSLSAGSGNIGTRASISGNFPGNCNVIVNNISATELSSSATSIVFVIPNGAVSGANTVVVRDNNNVVSNPVTLTVPAPAINSISPNNGPVGTSITITGGNFGAGSTVTIDGVSASISSSSTTKIVAIVPAILSAGANPVVVTNNDFISNSVAFTVTSLAISSLSPSSGAVGTSVTITGTNFTGATAVTFDGTPATGFTVNSGTQITATVPAGAATGDVTVSTASGTSDGISFTVLAIPTITFADISKTFGDAAFNLAATSNSSGAITYSVVSGTGATVSSSGEVTVTGAGSIQIKATQAANGNYTSGEKTITLTIQKAAATITLTAVDLTQTYSGSAKTVGYIINPAGITGVSVAYSQGVNAVASPTLAGTYNVVASLSNNNYTATNVTATLTIAAPTPGITGLSPSFGPVGTSVTITGTNFSGATGVSFNGTAATTFTANSATQITAIVPNGATIGNVVVSHAGENSNGVYFEVIYPPTITSLSPTRGVVGSLVTITGTNFTGATAVTFTYFGSTAATYTVISATQITAIVPIAGDSRVEVTTVAGTSNYKNFEAVDQPTITDLSPGRGAEGSPVTIRGTNFHSTYDVTLNGQYAEYTLVSATEITLKVPAGARSGDVVVHNVKGLAGASSNGVHFEVVPDIPTLSPGSGAVGTPVKITGTNLDKAYMVTFNGIEAEFDINYSADFRTMEFIAIVPAGATSGNVVVHYADYQIVWKRTYITWKSNGVYFTVSATPTITFADISKTFGDVHFNLAASSNSSGAITYSVVSGTAATVSASGEVTITGAGSIQIRATQAANGNYTSGEKTITLTIQKASAAITFTADDLNQTYNGSGKTVGYTTNPAGVTGVSVTYSQDGNAVASPTAAGSYSVLASLTNDNYLTTSATGTLVIGKAAATITLGNLTTTYTGSPLAATATTNPTGIAVNLSYDGAAQAPANAGSYAVTGTVNDDNYEGSASGTLVIGKAASVTTVTVSAGPYTYTGVAQTPASVTVTGAGGLNETQTATYTNNINAGTATASYTYAGDVNHEGSTDSKTFEIGKAASSTTVTINSAPFTYTGSAHTPATVSVTGAGALSLTPDAAYANNMTAGTATASYTFAGDANHTSSEDSKTFAIGKAAATIVVQGYSGVYDGNAHGTTGSVRGVNGETLTGLNLGSSFANVPGGTATWTYTDATGNYNNATGTAAIAISKADAVIKVTPYNVSYDGGAHTAGGTAIGVKTENLSGLALTGTTHTNAGTYANDAWTFTDVTGNYNDSSGSVTNVINKAQLTVTADNKAKVFDGKTYTSGGGMFTSRYSGFIAGESEANVTITGNITYSGAATAAIDASTTPYIITPVVGGLSAANYTFSPANGTLTINKAEACVTYNGDLFKNTTSTTGGSATVSLSVVITGTSGDVRSAQIVRFKVNGTAVAGTIIKTWNAATPNQVSYSIPYTVALSSSELSKTVDITWELAGNYSAAASCSDLASQVTISAPSTDFVTGGGYIKLTNSYGKYAGDVGTKNNFGFSVKWNKSFSTIQGGGINSIIRKGTTLYQIKGTKVTALAVKSKTATAPATASFTSNAVVSTIVNGVVVSSEGGCTAIVEISDICEPGSGAKASFDQIAITVKDKNGVVIYSSRWDATAKKTAKQTLEGGNIQIRSGTTTGAPACTSQAVTSTRSVQMNAAVPEAMTTKFELKAFPNPSATQFNVQLQSNNTIDRITLRVFDANGRTVGVIPNLTAGQTVQLGSAYRPGVYFVEMQQAKARAHVKLLKSAY